MLTASIRFSTRFAKSAKAIATIPHPAVSHLRHPQVMAFAPVRPDERPVKIHLGGGAQRVQLRGGGRCRRAENHRHEQADDAVREIIEDEGDEDVIGVLGFDFRIVRLERLFDLAANLLHFLLRPTAACIGCSAAPVRGRFPWRSLGGASRSAFARRRRRNAPPAAAACPPGRLRCASL